MTVAEAIYLVEDADRTCRDTGRHLQLRFWAQWLSRRRLSEPLDERDGMTISCLCEQVHAEQEARR